MAILTRGLGSSLKNLWTELKISRRHSRGVRLARRIEPGNGLKLNLGCGPNLKTGWINIDLLEPGALPLDLREPFPFPDNSCSLVYSEHFLEHLDYPDAVTFHLRESLRVLRPGGLLSAGVPDTEWPLFAYAGRADEDYFKHAKTMHPAWCGTRMDHLNYHFRQDTEHRYAYDFETFRSLLEKAGFTGVRRRDFSPELDTEKRRVGTLYIEAVKP